MLCLCFLIPWSHPSCLFAAGIFKYGVAHYDPPETRKHSKITAPKRPDVVFENAGAVAEDDADVLLLEHSGA